ncbi:Kunitz-type trypsin inhibitor [Heracleum sosnowskyi]|uniref:Kunitz-type trypsin inhibitor n=1 Tax=Heracleum sosnowskyi TaxID=360622 RepID=A0AAD8N751_9APIA|nr:Kunitz-type trypsin inhibitor [Heracleum sosnowskyi]
MKINLFYISFLLVALSTYSLVSGQESPDAVRDTDGDLLRAGVHYYILPVVRGMGGGVTLGSTRNESCPLDVVQETFETDKGNLPLTFTMVDPKKGVIRESTDLNIEFNGATICIQSLVWKLDNYDGEYVVSTRGVKGNPGVQTLESWFKIEKYLNDYRFVFCPTVCDLCKPICGGIGISIKNGVRRLVLSDKPFMVQFLKI